MCFCIDFGSVLASCCHQCSCFLVVSFYLFLDGIFMDLVPKMIPKNRGPELIFSSLVRPCSPRGVLGGPLPHFGTLLIPCWSLWAAFSLLFRRFWIPFQFKFGCFQAPKLSGNRIALSQKMLHRSGTFAVGNLNELFKIYQVWSEISHDACTAMWYHIPPAHAPGPSHVLQMLATNSFGHQIFK